MEKGNDEILKRIADTLDEINSRQKTEAELYEARVKIDEHKDEMSRLKQREETLLQQSQSSFCRIHDRVFHFNSVLIGVFLVLGTFPSDSPILKTWMVFLPVFILIFLVAVDLQRIGITERFTQVGEKRTILDIENFQKK